MAQKRNGAEMAKTSFFQRDKGLTQVSSRTRSEPEGDTTQEEEDLDNRQESELGEKRWKRDVATKMFASCAEDAASRATKEMASLMMEDAKQREQRLVETDRRMMEHLGVVLMGSLILLKVE